MIIKFLFLAFLMINHGIFTSQAVAMDLEEIPVAPTKTLRKTYRVVFLDDLSEMRRGFEAVVEMHNRKCHEADDKSKVAVGTPTGTPSGTPTRTPASTPNRHINYETAPLLDCIAYFNGYGTAIASTINWHGVDLVITDLEMDYPDAGLIIAEHLRKEKGFKGFIHLATSNMGTGFETNTVLKGRVTATEAAAMFAVSEGCYPFNSIGNKMTVGTGGRSIVLPRLLREVDLFMATKSLASSVSSELDRGESDSTVLTLSVPAVFDAVTAHTPCWKSWLCKIFCCQCSYCHLNHEGRVTAEGRVDERMFKPLSPVAKPEPKTPKIEAKTQ